MRFGGLQGLLLILSLPCLGQIFTRPGIWERRAPFPIEATEVSSAALNGRIYTVCGLTATGNSDALYIYDPRTDTWSRGAAIPIAGGADHCNFAAADGKLYLLGAIRIGGNFIDGNTYEYDPAEDRWQTVARMGTARGASGVAVIGDRIYVAGGLNAAGSVADFEVFDAAAKSWARLPDMPTRRDHLTAQAVSGRIYAIGGRSNRDLAANEEFDTAAAVWRERAALPRARGGLAGGVVDGRVIVFGGEGASGTPQNTFRDNDEYDPASDAWRPLAFLPTPRHGFYGATLDGRIFAPSGGPVAGANYSRAHEAFYYLPQWRWRFDGLYNAASYASEVAPGSLATIFGENLSLGEQVAAQPPATQMNGVRVRIGTKPARLSYVSPGRLDVVIPEDLPPGRTNLELSNAGWTTNSFPLDLLEAAPGIFTLDASGQGPGAVWIAGTDLLAQSSDGRPVRRGEVIEISCTGLGRNPVQVTVIIGGQEAEAIYAGRTGDAADGLDRVNATVPEDAPAGAEISLAIRAGARTSNTVTIAVAE